MATRRKKKARVKKTHPDPYADLNFEHSVHDAHTSNLISTYLEDAATLLASASLETKFLFKNSIPEQGICFLAGKPGSHKSWLAYHAAISVARHEPWLGFENCTDQAGSALILNFDNPSHELGRRFLRLGLKPDDPVYFHSMASKLLPAGIPAMLQLPPALEPLMHITYRLKPRLIVVDSYRQSHVCNEHDSSEMGRVMSCLKQLASTGATVLVLHHLRKQGQVRGKKQDDDQPLRGSTEIEASADSIFLVKNGYIELVKSRGWQPKVTKCEFSVLDEGDSTIVRSREDFETLIAILKDGPMTKTAIREAIGLNKTSCARLCTRAVEAGIIEDAPRRSGSSDRCMQLTEEYGGEADEWSDFDAEE